MTGRTPAPRRRAALAATLLVAWVAGTALGTAPLVPAAGARPMLQLQQAHAGFVPTLDGSEPIFVLLLGSDARPGEEIDGQRADSIHLVAINPEKGRGSIIGFPRDSWVSIPNYGTNKINAAMTAGGPDLVVQTVEALTGITIDYWALTWFEGFQAMVNDVGGLTVDVPFDVYDRYAHAQIDAGLQTLTGRQALSLARARHVLPQGDFGRSENQGLLMLSALKQFKREFTKDASRLFDWVGAGMRNVRTDLPLDQLVALAFTATVLNEKKIPNIVVPGSTGMAAGTSVVNLDMAALQAISADMADDGIVGKKNIPPSPNAALLEGECPPSEPRPSARFRAVTTLREELRDVHPGRQGLGVGIAIGVTVPGLLLRFIHPDLPHAAEALLFGIAIIGAAFLLSWAAEVAQLDISAGLAIAVLAFIAVLPEYAVDMVFAWKGGNAVEAYGAACHPPGVGGEDACSLALANMTGANRLLIGIGWSLVVFIAFWRSKGSAGGRMSDVRLERSHAVEVSFLALATLYSLTLPLKGTITLVDAAILVTIFAAYTWRVSRAPAEEPHLVGPARLIGTFRTSRRRLSVLLMFSFSAGVILACAEPFAEALVETGREFGISEFLLVQWLAPLASEAPELLVAGLYAWRLNTNAGLGTLVSSKVNQWTLLVGTLPIVFALASTGLTGLPIDAHQREELFLTAAQSFFALAVVATLSISVREALLLFGLFWTQFIVGALVPESVAGLERVGTGVVYLLLGLFIFARERALIVPLLRDGFRTPYARLSQLEAASAREIVGE